MSTSATKRTRRAARMIAAVALACIGGCTEPQPPRHLSIPGADPAQGRVLVERFGCGACHTIPRVTGARGVVGPPLTDFAQRTLLAGHLPNAPRTLVPFLIDPPALMPDTAMPSLRLTQAQARDIAAFLYTLGADRAEVDRGGPPLDLVPAARSRPDAPLAAGSARP